MDARNRHLRRWIPLALVVAAVAVPAAQAGTGPDDGSLSREAPALAATSRSPDDRALYRGTSEALVPASQSPDDRALYRGTSESLVPTSLGPDDRAFARNMREIEPGSVPVEIAPSGGFDWSDAVVGSAFGVGLALLGMGAILIAYRRRGALRTA
jgi:hypothetical protein